MALFPAYGVYPPTGINPSTASLPGGCIGQTPVETPATLLPTSDLVEEWRSDSGTTLVTGVSQWTGVISGTNAVQATGGAQPLIATDATFQNRPALTFDGSNDQLTVALACPAPGTTQRCYWFVFKQITWTSNDAILSGSGGASHVIFQTPGSPQVAQYNTSGVNPSAGAPLGTVKLGIVAFTNSTSDFVKLGSVTATGSNSGNASAASWVIGSFGGSGFGNFSLSGVLLTVGPLTQAKQDTLSRSYFRKFYGAGILS